MTWLGKIWPYVGSLEREVERLQERERRLLNIVLPRVGCDPLEEKPRKEVKAPVAGKPSRLQRGLAAIRSRARDMYVINLRDSERPASERKDETAA